MFPPFLSIKTRHKCIHILTFLFSSLWNARHPSLSISSFAPYTFFSAASTLSFHHSLFGFFISIFTEPHTPHNVNHCLLIFYFTLIRSSVFLFIVMFSQLIMLIFSSPNNFLSQLIMLIFSSPINFLPLLSTTEWYEITHSIPLTIFTSHWFLASLFTSNKSIMLVNSILSWTLATLVYLYSSLYNMYYLHTNVYLHRSVPIPFHFHDLILLMGHLYPFFNLSLTHGFSSSIQHNL